MMLNALYWREPFWLLLILLPIMLVVLIHYRQRHLWASIADSNLLPWLKAESPYNVSILTRSMLLLAWLLFCVALAGPRTPRYIPPSLQVQQEQVVAVIDFSESMKAKDAGLVQSNQSRIQAARQLLEHWLSQLPAATHFGLVVYAGHAHLLLKPTDDHALVKHYLENLDQIKPPTLGNELAGALALAAKTFQASKGKQHLLLMTDGDLDTVARQSAEVMIKKLRQEHNLRLQVIGIGGTEAVRVPATSSKPLIIDGKAVISRLESAWLKQLAGNDYFIKAKAAYQQTANELLALTPPRINQEAQAKVLWDEWFSVPLLTAIFMLLLALNRREGVVKK